MKSLSIEKALNPSGKNNLDWLFYYIPLILLALVNIYGLILLKIGMFNSNQFIILFIYTVIMNAFQFGRIIIVLFYKTSLNHTLNKKNPIFQNMIYQPSVSFVVPCMNEEKVIEETIARCFDVNYPKNLVEVLVIDDGSTDSTPKVLDTLNGKYGKRLNIIKFAKNRGKRFAMIEGFKKASGEIVIQLDSDSYIEATSFYNLIEPFKNPSIGAVCAHSDATNADKNLVTKMQAAYYYMSFRILKAVESTFNAVFCCSGCASAYRKCAVLPILDKWVNESFLGLPVMYGDDRSLTVQVIKEGFKTIYVWNAQAYTIVPETFRRLMIQQTRWKKSWIINAFKTGQFIFWKRPAVAILYFFPLMTLSFLNPFVALYALIYVPFVLGVIPYFYIFGILLMTSLIAIYYRIVAPQNPYWKYLFPWGVLSVFVLTYLLLYAAVTIQNRSWGTR